LDGGAAARGVPKNSLTMAAEPLSVMMSLDAVLDAILSSWDFLLSAAPPP
jgi:hypothetical protein